MSTGASFIGGINAAKRERESYVPLINSMTAIQALDRSGGRGGGNVQFWPDKYKNESAGGGGSSQQPGGISVPAGRAPSGGGGVRTAQADGAAYVDPSELPLGMRMNERNRAMADDSADKWVKQRQEDKRLGINEADLGIRQRVQDVNEAESKSKLKINEATEGRTADVHKLGMDREERSRDHEKMMSAFMSNDPDGVTAWWAKRNQKDFGGKQQIPLFEIDPRGSWAVVWPGSKGPESYSKDQLGELLSAQSPGFERPKSEREVIENKLLKEGKIAPKGYEGAGIKVKDMEDLRQKQAKYISESSVDDMDVPQITYDKAYEDLGRGGIFSQQQQEPATGIRMPSPGQASPEDQRQVVRTGTTRNGLKVVQYSDGSMDYIDPSTGRKVK